jgi:undecaprenyl phosphate N,N'-diacetylbacillosamine 1-phosphate transferase
MQHKQGFYEKYVKRLADIVCSLVVLAIFWWLYIILAILVRVKLGSPVLFKQQRPGKNEKIFNMYKFRTMTDTRDENGELLPDEVRLTRFGKALRATSLDELPEIFNILKGDMSLIGPRPLLVQYLPRYNEEQHHRHDVRPGLTGYAQAHGRNAVSWEEKFDMDVWYVNHVSMKTDIKVVLDTVKTVVKREGISSDTSVTMEEFMGSK